MKQLMRLLRPVYHFLLAYLGALYYRFPSRKLVVIGVTGTKGKSSTAEILDAILTQSGKKTALLGTIKFKIGDEVRPNLRKMTMPGRFFVHRFLADAVRAGCTHAVIEMTSEGAKQFRHRGIAMDALIFTNLAPEHIESHGSYEAYRDAKLSIARALASSSKKGKWMIADTDDKESHHFLSLAGVTPTPFALSDAQALTVTDHGSSFTWKGVSCESKLGGVFNVRNILAASTAAYVLGISPSDIAQGIRTLERIAGRMDRVEAGQPYPVVVDYAHTPDSLQAIYQAFEGYERVCVLGATGGGRDTWKRPVMGKMADTYCAHIILTNEDPYDEDPHHIVEMVREGIGTHQPEIIMDRTQAIARAIRVAEGLSRPAVLITGKGTDPYIMGPRGEKTPWSDRTEAETALTHSSIA